MGNCCDNSAEASADKILNNELTEEKKHDGNIKKLLFLGAGGSGKTTIFKQLKKIHGAGWNTEFLRGFLGFIHVQIVEQMQLSIESVGFLAERDLTDQHGDDYTIPDDFNPYHKLSQDAQNAVVVVKNHSGKLLTQETANACKILWNEAIIKDIYENRAIMKIEDTSAYFWDKIDEIMSADYVPNETDILFVRFRSVGVQEMKFSLENITFHLFDVGGQQSERKKWIHCFENVTAVIFVVSLSCYDEVMFEDENVNSMVDSIQLFDIICNNEWLQETSMILFLNKKDLFAKKLEENKPITLCPDFVDYNGDQTSFDDTTGYIKSVFNDKNKNEDEGKSIYTHITCATDKDNIQKVFDDVQAIVVGGALNKYF